MNAIYPLFEFSTDTENQIIIAKGISIINNNIEIEKLNTSVISELDIDYLTLVRRCLVIDKSIWEPKKRITKFRSIMQTFKAN